MLEQQELAQLAGLTQLRLPDEAAATTYRQNLSVLIQLAETITSADTNDTEPLISPLDMTQRLRADVVSEENRRELYQSLAPATEDGLYLVPKVLD